MNQTRTKVSRGSWGRKRGYSQVKGSDKITSHPGPQRPYTPQDGEKDSNVQAPVLSSQTDGVRSDQLANTAR
jgi:hypothetical protein